MLLGAHLAVLIASASHVHITRIARSGVGLSGSSKASPVDNVDAARIALEHLLLQALHGMAARDVVYLVTS